MNKKQVRRLLKKVWYFIWEDESIWSWIINVILAFVLIKFIVYPGLGFILNTSHPVVAVVSSSMEHRSVPSCIEQKNIEIFNKNIRRCAEYQYFMCGNSYDERKFFVFDEYWAECSSWYESNTNIVMDKFSRFSFKNGFNKGDIMILIGSDAENIEIGDVIVFRSYQKDPIIHRVVKKMRDGSEIYFQTKGDNNKDSIKSIGLDETKLSEDVVIGKAILRIPLLGYIKIRFVEMLKFFGLA